MILLLVSLVSAILSWKHQPVILYLAVIIAYFVLSIIILRLGLKLRRFLWASIVLALIGLTFIATLGCSIYREIMKKYRVIQQASQSENKADSDNPQDYEDVSAAYNCGLRKTLRI